MFDTGQTLNLFSLNLLCMLMEEARCAHCGAGTRLYNNGVPICVKCDDDRTKANQEKEFGRATSAPSGMKARHFSPGEGKK
jgi:hypothetical protein